MSGYTSCLNTGLPDIFGKRLALQINMSGQLDINVWSSSNEKKITQKKCVVIPDRTRRIYLIQ